MFELVLKNFQYHLNINFLKYYHEANIYFICGAKWGRENNRAGEKASGVTDLFTASPIWTHARCFMFYQRVSHYFPRFEFARNALSLLRATLQFTLFISEKHKLDNYCLLTNAKKYIFSTKSNSLVHNRVTNLVMITNVMTVSVK